jgi:hypothetical protein
VYSFFPIQDEFTSPPPDRQAWPVTMHPLKFTVQSLSVAHLLNVANLKNISVLARSRCRSFASVIIPNDHLTDHKVLKCEELFDLFPAISRFSIRFQIRPPTFSQASFVPFKPKLQMFQPPNYYGRNETNCRVGQII